METNGTNAICVTMEELRLLFGMTGLGALASRGNEWAKKKRSLC